jgi:hypothetical protein
MGKIYSSYNEVKDREDLPEWFKNFAAHIGDKYKDCRGKEITLIRMKYTYKEYNAIFLILLMSLPLIYKLCVKLLGLFGLII